MSEASILPLVTANVLLAALVLLPGITIGVALLHGLLVRRRPVRWVDIPGVGRIPVLRE